MRNDNCKGLARQATQSFSVPDIRPNWSAIQATPEHGSCQTCGLPSWSVAILFKIPCLSGWFCSIVCAECALFGPRCCRWCGVKLATQASRFCGDSCRRQSSQVPFGNRERLLRFLLIRYPRLSRHIANPAWLHCAHCQNLLALRRSDTKFCNDGCRKAFGRAGLVRTSSNSSIIPDNVQTKSMSYEGSDRDLESDLNTTVLAHYPGQKGPVTIRPTLVRSADRERHGR